MYKYRIECTFILQQGLKNCHWFQVRATFRYSPTLNCVFLEIVHQTELPFLSFYHSDIMFMLSDFLLSGGLFCPIPLASDVKVAVAVDKSS